MSSGQRVGLPDFTYPISILTQEKLLNIVISTQAAGVILEEIWSSEKNYQKILYGECTVPSGSNTCYVKMYEAPSGKKGFFKSVRMFQQGTSYDSTYSIRLCLYTSCIEVFRRRTTEEVVLDLVAPLRVDSGWSLYIYAVVNTTANPTYGFFLVGWEK